MAVKTVALLLALLSVGLITYSLTSNDSVKLRHQFTNLLGNSVEFTTDGTFSPAFAQDVDYYQKASYCVVDKIRSWSCGASCSHHSGMKEVTAVNNHGKEGQGYCGFDSTNNRIVVAFRGSDNLKNWIDNFEFLPVNYPSCSGCKVHDGFIKTLNEISPSLDTCLNSLSKKHTTAQIIVTGHSLGGALATLYALNAAKIVGSSRIFFMNFGSPRVGNLAFAEYFSKQVPIAFRVVNFRDIVPHVPPKNLMGFVHINTEAFMSEANSPNKFKICTKREDSSCSDQFHVFSTEQHGNYFGFSTGC